jgi:molybdopterin-containing oxidoreductase family iron-sulfur binding subunit
MYEGKDELTVIQEDIKRALAKPIRRWAMLIDLRRCVLCHACTSGCVAEQKSPPGIVYRPCLRGGDGRLPQRQASFHPASLPPVRQPPLRGRVPEAKRRKRHLEEQQGLDRRAGDDQLPGMHRLRALCCRMSI